MLREVAKDLFVTEQPLRFVGMEMGCRMTVLRLSGGQLLLHSPVRHSTRLEDELSRLGQPHWLVAPNKFHHLFVSPWHERFPEAQVLVPPGFASKRPDLAFATELSEEPPPAWAGELALRELRGFPLLNEFVFFHAPSATLVAADLAFNIGADSPFFTRLSIRMSGRLGELAPTVIEKLMIRDRKAFRESLERVLEWPFERVVVSHGAIVEAGGREALARGYDWLLEKL